MADWKARRSVGRLAGSWADEKVCWRAEPSGMQKDGKRAVLWDLSSDSMSVGCWESPMAVHSVVNWVVTMVVQLARSLVLH